MRAGRKRENFAFTSRRDQDPSSISCDFDQNRALIPGGRGERQRRFQLTALPAPRLQPENRRYNSSRAHKAIGPDLAPNCPMDYCAADTDAAAALSPARGRDEGNR